MARGLLEPGARDRQITIQAATEGTDAAGGPILVWGPLVTLPAAKLDTEGRERETAEQIASAIDTEWQINYRADMDPELVDVPKTRKIVHRGRSYDVVEALHLGRKDGIILKTIASTKIGSAVRRGAL